MQRVIGGALCACLVLTCAARGDEGKGEPNSPGEIAAPESVEGQSSDVAPFAYAYRKGAANNPIETRWLNPTREVLCGLLWEERRSVRHIEIEFLSAGATAPIAKQLRLVTRTAAAPFEEASVPSFGLGPQQEFTLKPTGDPVLTPRGTTLFTFASNNDINSIKVLYSANDTKVGVPVVRAFGRASWKKPFTVEIEWGFQPGAAGQRWDGRVEVYNGRIGRVMPLASGCGVVATDEHAWKDGLGATARRGIRLPVTPTAGDVNSRTIVTLWTSRGNVSFTPGDLESGPILIPSVGIYIATAASGLSAEQFQSQLAAKHLRTVRQQAREEPEASWASAMIRYHGKNSLPDFPKPPYEPAMQIDVPEKQLVAQWRLGDWHLKRWSQKVNDDIYCISIWEPWEPMGYTAIGLESSTNIRVLDLMGSADVARGGLNWWLFFVKHTTPWGKLADLGDGPLTAPGHSLKRMDSHYDQHHGGGHGRVLESCALHYLLTGDAAWLDKAGTLLANACDWTIQERKLWNRDLPPSAWCYGLQPPTDVCDGSDIRLFYSLNAWYYAGLKQAAEVLAGRSTAQYAGLVKEAELFRRDIRKAADRSMALSPVVKVRDGTYRRYVPFAPYMRGLGTEMDTGFSGYADGRWFEFVMGGLLLVRSGIYDAHEPVVQEMLDVYEDRLVQDGQNGQNGYNDAPALHLLLDDVPLFLRGMYNSYAAEVDPNLGYIFWEVQERQYARDKTFEEAAFLERVRAMLVMEDGKDLWLARATPRVWLEQGKKIAVKHAPTCFGTVAYEVLSDAVHGRITATVEMPVRNAPNAVRLRFRHPRAAPIKSVKVDGKPWPAFDRDKEAIELTGMVGTLTVVASY
ncbi:MAG: hypothetical protein ABSG53_02065 [Thermoguttaceae bacterium]